MSDLKPYYVVSDHPDLTDAIIADLQSSAGSDTIPNRVVEITDMMMGSDYTVKAMLTDEEAAILNNDERIRIVELDPLQFKNVIRGHGASRTGNFSNYTSGNSSLDRNYGLERATTSTNSYTVNYTSTNHTFTYNLDGTGVDIIVMDTGVEPGHPEFAVNADGTGGSRVVNHDWTQYGIITSTPTGGFLGDCEGHGSNCASIAAGNTNGWAPGAAIYSLRIIDDGTNGPYRSIYDGRTLGMVDELQAWQSIRAFHNAKSPTSTGYKRPTVVTASYGYLELYKNGLSSVYFRGATHALTTTTGAGVNGYGTIGAANGGDGSFGYRYTTVETEIQSCIAAGIIVVAAAGNNAHKADCTFHGTTGTDYNNYVVMNDLPGFPRPYHRGGTPGATKGVICVGALDNVLTSYDVKSYFSVTGPRVDIFAPGSYIMGAYANANYGSLAAIPDPRNSAYYLNKVSGTSQATPQVTGVVACLLQARPWMTATNVVNWLQAVGTKNAMNESGYVGSGLPAAWQSGTWTNMASLQGGTNTILFQPFSLPDPLTIHG